MNIFSVVHLMSQAEVLALFASAVVIIAPHGAGLSNMIVARYVETPSNFERVTAGVTL
jgi:capsular polysaccharide biosynthesis protein